MGIDPSSLPPWAQKQITEKLLAQQRERALNAKKQPQSGKQNKYRNQPTERIAEGGKTLKFQSKLEARRYDELMLMLKAGQISDLKLQPQYTLQEAYTTPEGNRIRAIRYDADFSYIDADGKTVVEDAKSNATRTRVYSMKRKLLHERFGITIVEIE